MTLRLSDSLGARADRRPLLDAAGRLHGGQGRAEATYSWRDGGICNTANFEHEELLAAL